MNINIIYIYFYINVRMFLYTLFVEFNKEFNEYSLKKYCDKTMEL